ncbi:MAG TPA: NAD(P)-binding domain-containing protein [Candidatus Acidoferrum sp.]|jgi:putative flavoprotein involved in K+ transport
MATQKDLDVQKVDTLVVGAGQAGLSVGYFLAKRAIPFMILDANPRIGDSWRNRWDSLRLFTTARYSGLVGMPFPARGSAFPNKEQMADYLERFAQRFQLPVKMRVKVERVSKPGTEFVIETSSGRFTANNVVVAMGNNQQPNLPPFASELDRGIVQLHSLDYRNPSQLREGRVLVVGVGNSGADIAMDVARSHPTWIAGKESGHIPWPIDDFLGRNFYLRLIRFLGHHVLTVRTPIGRRSRPKLLGRAAPLIRVKPHDLGSNGIQRVGKVTGVRDGKPMLGDSQTLEVANVIWCTGFTPGFSWIDLPVFDADGRPDHECGVAKSVPGLYFVGLRYLFSMTSDAITGVGRDAERIVKAIHRRSKASHAA